MDFKAQWIEQLLHHVERIAETVKTYRRRILPEERSNPKLADTLRVLELVAGRTKGILQAEIDYIEER